MTKKYLFAALAIPFCAAAMAQNLESSAQYLKAYPAATGMTFQTNADINQYPTPAAPINWGMDVAWNSADNVTRGTNYIGEVLNIGRVSFQPSDLVDENGQLSDEQKKWLQSRLNNIAISGVKDIILNCDHEVLCNKDGYPNCDQNYANYHGKPYEWYRVIKASVNYCKLKGFNVITISPFNEPDLDAWKEGSKDDFREICRYISEDPDLAGIRISAGNTLNCDRAEEWYSYMKPYVTEGNTHQLAGDFNHYADFWKLVAADDNHGTADELHNVMEAFVGIHYGMNSGVWWGFEGAARGEFCRSSHYGKEIGYAENRKTWTAATVYKRPDGRIDAFLGGSERQANDCNYDIISTDRPVYFDGEGPAYNYFMQVPGGTGYQVNQPNAERMIQIQYGDDVPCEPITNGEFVIMSAAKTTVLGLSGGQYGNGTPITLGSYTLTSTNDYQRWRITPVNTRQGTDFSYCYITTARENMNFKFDVSNWSTSDGATIMAYDGSGGANEQWIFEYAGDNFWYIRSRHSGFYLDASSNALQQKRFTGSKEQKWRFIPSGTRREFNAPKTPVGLVVTPRSASILLTWDANTDSDLLAYEVLRAKADSDEWDMIGRMVKGNQFLDNMLTAGTTYKYKVRALDNARNRSELSEPVTATTADKQELIARYSFEENLTDACENHLNAQCGGEQVFSTINGVKDGANAIRFTSQNKAYIMVPKAATDADKLTVSMWVHNLSSTKNNTVLFDFATDIDHRIYLIPSNGNEMQLVLKNGEQEQVITAEKLGASLHHLAVTIARDAVALYIDGEKKAEARGTNMIPSDIHPVVNYIGRSMDSANDLFLGNIDDLRFYNYPLTSEQVAEIYNGTDPAGVTTITNNPTRGQIYDLHGRPSTTPTHGIYIQDGKKVVVRAN